jgi:hypothetical protein
MSAERAFQIAVCSLFVFSAVLGSMLFLNLH